MSESIQQLPFYLLDLMAVTEVAPSVVRPGVSLALGFFIGLVLWGVAVERESVWDVLRMGFGVSFGILLGFPVWVHIGTRLGTLFESRFRDWLVLGGGLGITFGAGAWLITAILTGRLNGPFLLPIEGLRLPLALGLWTSVPLGVGVGVGRAARSKGSGSE